ncbi:MAG TPA: glycosyltransferase family 4 protein [Balneolales bacterium]|nr:glycosyltransferase family 4 protein [Balneolales bacterium]
MSVKVVHLTSVHVPFDTRIFHRECKSLSRHGYHVVLIAQHDHDETIDGITIQAVPKINGKLERLMKSARNVYQTALQHPDAALVHFHDPELIPFGLLLKRKGFKVIYDVHENVPRQILAKDWIPSFLRKPLSGTIGLLEKWAANRLDHIIVTIPDIQKRFEKNHCTIVHNFPRVVKSDQSLIPYSERPQWISYIGGITPVRGALEMVKAVEIASKNRDMTLVLGGRIAPEQFKGQLQQEAGWQNVDYRGWVHRSEFEDIMNHSKMGLVTMKPSPNHLIGYPTKLLEYLAYGLPVISSDFPFCKEIIETAQCGILVNPNKSEAIANAITWILDHPEEAEAMGQRGKEYVLKHFTWDSEEKQLLKVYEEVLGN